MKRFLHAVKLYWKIEFLVVVVILTDFLDFDTNLHSLLCSFFGRQCSAYPYDLPFWEVMVSLGTILASYYAARNIRLVDEIEKAKYMPVLKIGQGYIRIDDHTKHGTQCFIPITNIGEGVALKTHLYLVNTKSERELIDGMFDISKGDKQVFSIGKDKLQAVIKLINKSANRKFIDLGLYVEYEDIYGTRYASKLPYKNLQEDTERNQIIIPRSGWQFVGKRKNSTPGVPASQTVLPDKMT